MLTTNCQYDQVWDTQVGFFFLFGSLLSWPLGPRKPWMAVAEFHRQAGKCVHIIAALPCACFSALFVGTTSSLLSGQGTVPLTIRAWLNYVPQVLASEPLPRNWVPGSHTSHGGGALLHCPTHLSHSSEVFGPSPEHLPSRQLVLFKHSLEIPSYAGVCFPRQTHSFLVLLPFPRRGSSGGVLSSDSSHTHHFQDCVNSIGPLWLVPM